MHQKDGDIPAAMEKQPLQRAIALTSVVFLAEFVGGIISGSLFLLGDAVHMLQDIPSAGSIEVKQVRGEGTNVSGKALRSASTVVVQPVPEKQCVPYPPVATSPARSPRG